MLTASRWQWRRHLEKVEYIKVLEARLTADPLNEDDLLNVHDPLSLLHRRVTVEGEFDFSHEFILRNRAKDGLPGVHLITPFYLKKSKEWVLVDRGFLPLRLSERNQRKNFQREKDLAFTGLVKESVRPSSFLAPQDPPAGGANPWVDAWLRVNIEEVQKQLPYKVRPYFLEIVNTTNVNELKKNMYATKSGRDEMLFLGGRSSSAFPKEAPLDRYPEPVFDAVVPPYRHLGYVFEWAFMALLTFLIGIFLQIERSPHEEKKSETNI